MCSIFRNTFAVVPEVSMTTGSVDGGPDGVGDSAGPGSVKVAVRRGMAVASGDAVHPASNGSSITVTSPRRRFLIAIFAPTMTRV